MINILSYVGMSLQSEVCLWTLLGLLRTIFDATLFKVNANLKQVWQMSMPEELSMSVQRVLRTMISGVMLVQCFTVYVYLASYIVLLYPVFLEERPTLVLPWLLLAAIRKLLCELTSLALGLGTCLLLGPARPSCIKFVIIKVASIMPAFYMWMLVFSYYHTLKVAAAFKTFPAVLQQNGDHNYGLELAVRRRRTKSLFGEELLRRKLIANFYGDRRLSSNAEDSASRSKSEYISRMVRATETSNEETKDDASYVTPISATPNQEISNTASYEEWFNRDIVVPRDSDRILEQFGVMLLRIGTYLKEGVDPFVSQCHSAPVPIVPKHDSIAPSIPNDCNDTDTPPQVGNSRIRTASYLRDYPQIFMKKSPDLPLKLQTDHVSAEQSDESHNISNHVQTVSIISNEDEAKVHPIIKTDKSKKITKKKSKTRELNKSKIQYEESIDSLKSIIENLAIEKDTSKEDKIHEADIATSTHVIFQSDSHQSITSSMRSVVNEVEKVSSVQATLRNSPHCSDTEERKQ